MLSLLRLLMLSLTGFSTRVLNIIVMNTLKAETLKIFAIKEPEEESREMNFFCTFEDMPQTIKIQINPQILQWARLEAGYDENIIADKLHIPIERYKNWETTGREIPLGMLKNIADYYKRQLAVFLLSSTPPKLKKPKDFRNLVISKINLSPETLLAMRRANKYLILAREILGEQYWENQYNWLSQVENLVKTESKIFATPITNWLRALLKITITEQQKFKSYDDAFRKWRGAVERELGIFVFQFPMPEQELDGFCYAEDKPPYSIVINSDSHSSRKIFTLFHELAHIFKHQSGICLPDMVDEKQEIEFEFNKHAGKFLIPDNFVYPVDNIGDLTNVARRFKVSREVYLRRNLEQEFLTKKDFFRILKDIKEQPTTTKKDKKGGPIKPSIKSKSTRGEKFYNLILDAVYSNKIDYTTASDALGLNYNHIVKNE
jgi:Zn-dependent peptidase ImmA (M78 family)